MSFIIYSHDCIIALVKTQYIRLGQALDLMDQVDEHGKPVPFQIKFVTANRKLGKGGDIVELPVARKCIGKRQGKVIFDKREKMIGSSHDKISKNPRHWVNSTRNLLLPNGQIRKVHIRLIIEFNNLKVCY